MEDKKEIPKYTLIFFELKRELDLSFLECAVCDVVYHLSNNPNTRWCFASKNTLAGLFDITKRSLLRILDRLEERELIERHPETRHLRTTQKWYDSAIVYREYMGGDKKSPMVTNSPKGGDIKSPHAGDKKSPNNNNIDKDIDNNKTEDDFSIAPVKESIEPLTVNEHLNSEPKPKAKKKKETDPRINQFLKEWFPNECKERMGFEPMIAWNVETVMVKRFLVYADKVYQKHNALDVLKSTCIYCLKKVQSTKRDRFRYPYDAVDLSKWLSKSGFEKIRQDMRSDGWVFQLRPHSDSRFCANCKQEFSGKGKRGYFGVSEYFSGRVAVEDVCLGCWDESLKPDVEMGIEFVEVTDGRESVDFSVNLEEA